MVYSKDGEFVCSFIFLMDYLYRKILLKILFYFAGAVLLLCLLFSPFFFPVKNIAFFQHGISFFASSLGSHLRTPQGSLTAST